MRLKGKVAVITQAGSIFGRAAAQAYAREGAVLFLQDWKERSDRLHSLTEELRTEGATVEYGVHDLAIASEVEKMTKQVIDRHERIDILVNTSMEGGHGRFLDIREEEWDLSYERGLKSYFFTCQYIGEEMALAGYGKIINLTSIVANLGSGGAIPWCTVRGGVNSLTYAVAQSLGEWGVRCVGLARGAMEGTPYTEEARNERLLRLPFRRLGLEEDLYGPFVFLASSESDYITGSVVYCDGGYAHAAATDAEHRASEIPLKTRGSRTSREPREKDWIDTDVA